LATLLAVAAGGQQQAFDFLVFAGCAAVEVEDADLLRDGGCGHGAPRLVERLRKYRVSFVARQGKVDRVVIRAVCLTVSGR
jgi:hypothetical protein